MEALKDCLKKSFFGSVLSAGTTLATGHFTLIPITAKFVTNFTFCLKDYYPERWNKAKERLYEIEIKNQTIDDFRDELLSINYHQLSVKRSSILNVVLNSSLNVLKDSIDNWIPDKFESIVKYCLEQTREIDITRDDYSILNRSLRDNQQNLINNILSKSFVKAVYNYVPYVSNAIDRSLLEEVTLPEAPNQIIRQITMLPNLLNGRMAAEVVKFLYRFGKRNAGWPVAYITYKDLEAFMTQRDNVFSYQRACGISYGYSNDLLNRLDRYVVRIDKGTRPHRICISPIFDEVTFYKTALKGLRRH